MPSATGSPVARGASWRQARWLAVVLCMATACSTLDTTATPPDTTAPPPEATPASGEATSRSIVDLLTVAPEGSMAGYDRDLFGPWIDTNGDTCGTRCKVVARQRRDDLPGLRLGGWLSVYDGYTTDDSSELDINHLVPLAEAWRSGASTWDPARRRAFANDLEPGALITVTPATNRSRGDRDPTGWQPPARDSWCQYGTSWATTKLRWDLTADEAEVQALRTMLADC